MHFAHSHQILQVATAYPFKKRNRMWILQDIRNRISAPAIYTKSYVSSCNVYEVVYIATIFFNGTKTMDPVVFFCPTRVQERTSATTTVFGHDMMLEPS